jgi:DNA end-binding protein Ku
MAAGPRAYWKGYLRLSLVSISVELYSATNSASSLALHQIHKPSGQRVRYEKVVPNIGPIDSDEIVKGYEVDDGTYVILEPDELDEIKLESRRTIELVQFVKDEEIDARWFDRPYYLMPEGDVSTEGYLVIREALGTSKRTGLGQMTMRGREYLVSVQPHGKGLLLNTLRYKDEVRAAEPLFREIPDMKLDKDMIGLASELIQRKAGSFDPSAFKDHYATALRELIERKHRGQAIVSIGDEKPERRSSNVIDLMAALKKSVAQDAAAPVPKGRKIAQPTKRASGKGGDRKSARGRASR